MLSGGGADNVMSHYSMMLTLLLRLRQCCCDPSLIDPSDLKALSAMVEKLNDGKSMLSTDAVGELLDKLDDLLGRNLTPNGDATQNLDCSVCVK